MKPFMTDAQFWALINKNGPVVRPELGPCWIWEGDRFNSGYGRVSSTRWPTRIAHRVAAILSGILTDLSKDALHKCDNPPCCNPAHLYAGTDSENNKDAFARCRRTNRGGSNPNSKLSQQQVNEIRALYGKMTQPKIAERFGVSLSLVEKILARKNWRVYGQ